MKHFTLLPILLSMTACTQSMKARDAREIPSAKVVVTASFHSLAELPRCDAGTEAMNAYISERDVFVKCRGFFWRDVKPGDSVASYSQRGAIHFHEWVDAQTRLRWALPQKSEVALEKVKSGVCSPGFKLPTREELAAASANGLFEGLKARGGIAFDRAWTAEYSALSGLSKSPTETSMSAKAQGAPETAGVYCVAAN